jgi:hypothetical protein
MLSVWHEKIFASAFVQRRTASKNSKYLHISTEDWNMRLKSFLIIGLAMLTLVGCSGGGGGEAPASPAAGAATPAATASKAP